MAVDLELRCCDASLAVSTVMEYARSMAETVRAEEEMRRSSARGSCGKERKVRWMADSSLRLKAWFNSLRSRFGKRLPVR